MKRGRYTTLRGARSALGGVVVGFVAALAVSVAAEQGGTESDEATASPPQYAPPAPPGPYRSRALEGDRPMPRGPRYAFPPMGYDPESGDAGSPDAEASSREGRPQPPPRPEWAGPGLQFDESGRPIRPERPDWAPPRPPRSERAGRGPQFDEQGRPVRPEPPPRPEWAGPGMQLDEQGRPMRPARPDWAPQRPPRPDWAGRGPQFDQQGRPVRPERPPRPEWAGPGMQPDQHGRPMRPGRPDWAPQRPPRPDWAGRGMQLDDNGRPMRPPRPDWAPRRTPYGPGRGPMPPAGYAPQQATPPAAPQYGPNTRWAPSPRPGFRSRPAWAARPFYGPRPLPGYPPHRGNGKGNGNGVAPAGPGPLHRGPKLAPPNGPAVAQRPAWGPRTYWWRPMPTASRFRPRSAPMRPPADYGYHRRPHAPAQMYAMGPSLRPW